VSDVGYKSANILNMILTNQMVVKQINVKLGEPRAVSDADLVAALEGQSGRIPKYCGGVIRQGYTGIAHACSPRVRFYLEEGDGCQACLRLGNTCQGDYQCKRREECFHHK